MMNQREGCGWGGGARAAWLRGIALGLFLAAAGAAQAGGRFYFTTILTNSAYASGRNSGPSAINDAGYVCGTAPYGGAWQAARWDPRGAISELGVYDTNTDTTSDAFGLNGAADIAGCSSHDVLSANNAVVFRGTNVVRVPLDNAGQARAVNSGGRVVGYTVDALDRPIAFLWDGAATNVQFLGETDYEGEHYVAAWATAINVHTQVAGHALNQLMNQSRAMIWSPSAGLALLPAVAGRALNRAIAILDSGAMLGYSANGGNEDRISWMRTAGGVVSILPDTALASNHNVQAMNDYGVVVGISQMPGDERWGAARYDAVRGWRFLHALIGDDMARYDADSLTAVGINNRGRIIGSILGRNDHYYGALFTPVAERRNDFDGDGKSDPALYDPAGGGWYVFLSGSGYALGTLLLGGADLPAFAADFDGDGKADLAVYDAEGATLYARLSANGYLPAAVSNFGGAGCEPVTADFDGDGKADPAVYDEPPGIWLYRLSGSNYISSGVRGFGGPGCRPVPADYDGDRKTDLAVCHEGSGSWFIRLSTTGAEVYAGLGGAGYEAVYGDYDGDGLCDPAAYDEASGRWAIRMSRTGTVAGTAFGGPDWTALPVDFDGDGLGDPAAFRASDAVWAVELSGSGYAPITAYFGGAGLGYVPVR